MEKVLQDIYIGNTSMDSIEFKHQNIEVPLYNGEDQEFQIFIKNYGPPTALTFNVDRSIEDYVILIEGKPYVHNNYYSRVILRVPYNQKPVVEGKFYVVTGYGSKKASFNLRIGMKGGENSNYYQPSLYEENTAFKEEPEITYIPPGSFKIRDGWRDIRRKNVRKGKFYGFAHIFVPNSESPNPADSEAAYPVRTKQIRTTMDIGGIIISLLFVLSFAAFFFYILKTDVADTLTSSQVWILSAIIVGFSIFIILFILNFFKTTVEDI